MVLGFVTSTSASEELTLVSIVGSIYGADDAGTPRWAQDIVHEALTRSHPARTVIVPTANFADSWPLDFQAALPWYSENESIPDLLRSISRKSLVVIGRSGKQMPHHLLNLLESALVSLVAMNTALWQQRRHPRFYPW